MCVGCKPQGLGLEGIRGVSFSGGDGLDMVRFVDIRVSTRLALAAAVFTVAKENTFRFLACYVYQRGL